MASLNQLISEIAHAVGDPNSVPLRRNIRYAILHTRNELIRKSYENHHYIDKGLQQRFRISLIDVPDGDLHNSDILKLPAIKRSVNKIRNLLGLLTVYLFNQLEQLGLIIPK